MRTDAAPKTHGRAWVLGKYVLFQIPGFVGFSLVLLGAVSWLGLPQRIAWLLLAAWVVKDVVLFPVVRVAYEPASPGGADALVGTVGIALQRLDPEGYVRVGSESWRAEVVSGAAAVPRGARVRVREVRGLTLRVEAE